MTPPAEERTQASVRARPVRLVAVALATATALTSCTSPESADPAPASSAPAPSSTSARSVEVVASELEVPWSLVFDGDTPLLSERDSGRILELAPDGTPREVGVIDGATHRGEGGLLGIAVHDRDLYAYLTTATDNRIVRYPLTGDAGRLGLGEPDTILDGLPSASYHNGGRIAFSPDGMLYATIGDAGNRPTAQDLASLGGKILRLTPDGDVPSDNPFPDSLVYSYGHRNPQGLAWGPDGTLYASEFGQDTWDELNIIEPGGNYGWPTVEGIADQDGFTDPVQQWAPSDASPSGMTIAGGAIYLANLRGERLRLIPLDDLSASTELLAGEYGRLRDVILDPDGALWVLTNNTDGRGQPGDGDDRILRIQP